LSARTLVEILVGRGSGMRTQKQQAPRTCATLSTNW